MTTFIEELDKILNAHAQEFRAGHLSKIRDSLLNLVSERIIGNPQMTRKAENDAETNLKIMRWDDYRNGLREEQRTTLYEGTKEVL